MMEREKKVCKRILEGSITYPEGAKKLKLSLSSMNRRMRLFKAEHQEGEDYGGIYSEAVSYTHLTLPTILLV